MVLVLFQSLAVPAFATLKIYYDPDTGNISFDTSLTRSGEIFNYYFRIDEQATPWRFRPENLVRLSTGTLFTAWPNEVGDSTQTSPWRGLYTIGDVFPAGFTEEYWTTAFSGGFFNHINPVSYGYVDIPGNSNTPPAEFIYGRPQGEFENHWDLVDPNTLTWAQTARLVYHAWSGEVIVDTTGASGGHISSLLLLSNERFNPEGFVAFSDGPFNSATESEIGLFADAIEPGRYSIGTILPAGLSAAEYQAAFTSARFLGRAGFNGGSFDFETHGAPMLLQYLAVPEPNCMALSITGLLIAGALVRLKRRPSSNCRPDSC
jgi:hypothetical protein